MGLGKTISTLTALNKLMYEELEISSALVVGPKRVIENVWTDEIQKWSHINHLTTSLIVGSKKERISALKKKADIYLISRDNIAWLCGEFGGSSLPFDMLVLDELSSFKNPKSVRFKALRAVQPSFKRIVGLTGTPAPNSLIDLWSQMYLLDRGERLGKYITRFREDYFRPGLSNGNVVYKYNLQKGGEEMIHEKIKDICISMKTEDYLDLPERIDNIIEVKFTKDLQKKYNDFEKEKVLELFSGKEDNENEETISAVNAAALSNKLLQFANGAVYDEDRKVHVVHDMKIDVVKELVEDLNGEPVLIAWAYRHDLDRLKKALAKYDPVELKDKGALDKWNRGEVKVMLTHPASGGHGLNLQRGGNHVIWFGQTWSLELEQQFNARLHRQGQTKNVIIHKIVASKTIDVDVIAAQESKGLKQNSLMDAVKARIKKYIK